MTNIMFVDDEANVLQSLKWIFVDEPYQFFAFDSPIKALNKMEETEFAVTVADQRMPEMEGTVFLEKVKERWPDTVRIIMTAYADFAVAVDAINQGNVYRIIFKPLDTMELKLTVKNAVSRYELQSENRRLFELTKTQNEQLRELNRNLETQYVLCLKYCAQ